MVSSDRNGGVITKNVGVNYVPLGQRSGNKESGERRGLFGRGGKEPKLKPPANARDYNGAQITKYIKQNAPKSFRELPDRVYSNVVNDPKVKNAFNDKEACNNAVKIISNALLDETTARFDFLLSNGINPWQDAWMDYKVQPGQKMSLNQAEYKFYNRNAIDITKDLGYNFTGNNAPKVKAILFNGAPTGKGGFYNGRYYDNINKMVKDYTKDVYKGAKGVQN